MRTQKEENKTTKMGCADSIDTILGKPSEELKMSSIPAPAVAIDKLQFFEGPVPYPAHEQLCSSGYYFDLSGTLCSTRTGKHQALAYSARNHLYQLIIEYVQQYLVRSLHLRELWVPFADSSSPAGKTNIFVSADLESNANACLVLIQGTGGVRAGIWSRSCCVEASLDIGSMIPYVTWAAKLGVSCVIMNPNHNADSESMADHCAYVWNSLVKPKCPAKSIYIVAHSAGGMCFSRILKENTEEFFARVKAVALSDSFTDAANPRTKEFLQKCVVHFAVSPLELGKPLKSHHHGAAEYLRTVSAGHVKHEFATGTARKAILQWFEESLMEKVTAKGEIKVEAQQG